MKITEAISKRIRQLLNEKNMSLYRLEKITVLPHTTITNINKAKHSTVNLKILFLICQGLGVSIVEFFNSPLFLNNEDLEID